MNTTVLVVNLLMLGVVLESDLGRRRIGWFRLGRPLLTLPVVLTMVGLHPASSGNGLLFDVAGAVVGIVLGLAAGALMRVEYDGAKGRAVSRAGLPYAALWLVIIGGRLLFLYGTTHWFGRQVGEFLVNNRISTDAFAASFILMAFAMALTRTASLAVRSVRVGVPEVSLSQ
jgi:hypothetical protein